LARMKNNLDNETAGEKEDILFHITLAGSTHNSIMMRLLETISAQMELAIRETHRLMYANKSVSQQLYKEHQDIYQAILAADSEEAQNKMKKHLFHVERVLISYLK
jgi:GntR family transcriptional repressor for pyruvate dehydrogenase complex